MNIYNKILLELKKQDEKITNMKKEYDGKIDEILLKVNVKTMDVDIKIDNNKNENNDIKKMEKEINEIKTQINNLVIIIESLVKINQK
jgi:hypothetical protein